MVRSTAGRRSLLLLARKVDHQVAAHLVQADHHGAGGTHGLDCNKLVVGTGTYQLLRTLQIKS